MAQTPQKLRRHEFRMGI